jgi:hypothetical protein
MGPKPISISLYHTRMDILDIECRLASRNYFTYWLKTIDSIGNVVDAGIHGSFNCIDIDTSVTYG